MKEPGQRLRPGSQKGRHVRTASAMTERRGRSLLAGIRGLSLAAALVFVVGFLAVAWLRVDYPFEIEWMEGGSSGHVERIRAGAPLYGKPTLAFTPFIYTPFYFQIGAWVSPIAGTGFIPLRTISTLATLGCFALIAAFVWCETRDRTAAALAAGMFAATFRISGSWFDLARVDSLFLFWTLAAIYVLRFGRGWRAGAFAGLLGACAFFTKQTALPILGAFAVCALAGRRPKWFAFFGTLIALVVGLCLYLHLASDGWFSYYVFELPGQHRARWYKIGPFFGREILWRLPFVVAGALMFFALMRGRESGDRGLFYAIFVLGTLAVSLFSRIHSGGYVNVLMPGYAGLTVVFGLGTAALLARAEATGRPAVAIAVFAACLLQFGMLRYDPRRALPTAADRAAGERLVASIRGFDGEVLVPFHGYLPALAGKPRSGQWMAIADVLRGDRGDVADELESEIRDAILARRFAAIFVDRDDWYAQELASAYVLQGELFDDRSTFLTRTGDRKRPNFLFVPKAAASRSGASARSFRPQL